MVVEDAALDCGRMDLVQLQVRSEQLLRLGELAPKGGRAEVFALLYRLGQAPLAGVGVAPLRADN